MMYWRHLPSCISISRQLQAYSPRQLRLFTQSVQTHMRTVVAPILLSTPPDIGFQRAFMLLFCGHVLGASTALSVSKKQGSASPMHSIHLNLIIQFLFVPATPARYSQTPLPDLRFPVWRVFAVIYWHFFSLSSSTEIPWHNKAITPPATTQPLLKCNPM